MKIHFSPTTRSWLALAIAGFLLVWLGLALAWNSREAPPASPDAPDAVHQGGTMPRPTQPLSADEKPEGLIRLDDFQIVISPAWQRLLEWEDDGPGTKLFLEGPSYDGVSLIIGIDVFPVSEETTLKAFADDFVQRWEGQQMTIDDQATLCDQPAQMVRFTDGDREYTYLLMLWRSKGFVVGMIAPRTSHKMLVEEFRAVMDTFQVYE